MNSFRLNRIQSAYPQSVQRSPTSVQPSNTLQRANTSINISELDTSKIKLPAWRTAAAGAPPTPSGSSTTFHRPKTTSISTASSSHIHVDELPANEIERLLRCLDRDEKRYVRVNCLADYRKLVQAINIRQTPLDRKSLCVLQQRENRIVQRNACRDRRFRLLMESLSPSHQIGDVDPDFSETNENNLPDFRMNNCSVVC